MAAAEEEGVELGGWPGADIFEWQVCEIVRLRRGVQLAAWRVLVFAMLSKRLGNVMKWWWLFLKLRVLLEL